MKPQRPTRRKARKDRVPRKDQVIEPIDAKPEEVFQAIFQAAAKKSARRREIQSSSREA